MQSETADAKLSERKTVHEWLNAANVPQTENGKQLCLLRRLRIAIDRLETLQSLLTDESYRKGPLEALRLLAAAELSRTP